MDFSVIEGLNEEDITKLYDDVVEGLKGDDTRMAGCCCWNNTNNLIWSPNNKSECTRWCRFQGSYCRGWDVNTYCIGSC